MNGLQQRCKEFIVSFISMAGIPPSYQQIMDGMGLRSKSGVHRLIEGLEMRGHLKRINKRARTLEVLRPLANVTRCPHCNHVIAGVVVDR